MNNMWTATAKLPRLKQTGITLESLDSKDVCSLQHHFLCQLGKKTEDGRKVAYGGEEETPHTLINQDDLHWRN